MRVLVTGGAGFIGSTIVRHLHARGDEVLVLDDLSTGTAGALPPGVEVIEHDIADPAVVDAVARVQPTHVVHAAAQVRVDQSMLNPVRDRSVNLDGTRHVVAGAAAAAARRIVFLSSGGAVYGSAVDARETDVPHPISYYGIHKLAAEGYVAIGQVSYAIARLANVYGPGQRAELEGGVVATFCRAHARSEAITIHGDGRQRRDFVHVEDVRSAIVAMLDDDRPGVWNVATGVSTSIIELAGFVDDAFGWTAPRLGAQARVADVPTSSLSVERIREELGWMPVVDIAAGLATIASRMRRSDRAAV